MSIATHVAELAAPWASVYGDSPVLQTAILFAHLAGVVVGGGCALVADQATIRAARSVAWTRRRRQLAQLRTTHAPVLAGLSAALASGVLLFAADVERFGASPTFWAKMALVALLLANGAVLARTERRLRGLADYAPDGWRPLRAAAMRSVSLWMGALLAGTYLLSGN